MTMTDKDTAGLRPEAARKHFERELKSMREALIGADHAAAVATFIELEWGFEQQVLKEQAALLSNPLLWDEADGRLAQWILRQFTRLADLGASLVERLSGTADRDPVLSYLIARALVHRGNVWKWQQFAHCNGHEQGPAKVNALHRWAIASGAEDAVHCFDREGRTVAAGLAGLTLRAHLLARLASGNLNRKQIEIVDAWLWASMDALTLTVEPPAGPALRLDPDGRHGLRFGIDRSARMARYLSLDTLHRLLDRVEQGFHRGTIFPGYGSAHSFRLEEHVAVLDFLRALLTRMEGESAPPRAARSPRIGRKVEVHIGLSDAVRALRDRSAAQCALPDNGQGDPNDAFDGIYQRRRRFMHLVNCSDTGMGLEVAAGEAADLGVGELIAVHCAGDSEPALGQVVRIAPADRNDMLHLGVQVISPDWQTLDMAVPDAPPGRRDASGFFVPGNDSSGHQDVLLISHALAQSRPCCQVRVGAQTFDLQIEQISRTGRGWVAAGFEVVAVSNSTERVPAGIGPDGVKAAQPLSLV